MSTAEMSMTTNTARALIDARLEAVERALIGRLSRSERMDIVGEVESRIDELLRERCGAGVEPSREDVLAVLLKIDPPEAYLDFDAEDDVRPYTIEKPVHRSSVEVGENETKLKRRSRFGAICGVVGVFSAIISPVFILLAEYMRSVIVFVIGFGGCVLICIVSGMAAIALSVMGQHRSGWTIAGHVLGVMSIMLSMIGLFVLLVG